MYSMRMSWRKCLAAVASTSQHKQRKNNINNMDGGKTINKSVINPNYKYLLTQLLFIFQVCRLILNF